MCGKGSQTTTTSSAPNPQAMGAYSDLLSRASGVSGLPFQTYGGEFVAPLNQQQQQAGANINQYAGFALPFIDQARGYATQAAQPITGSDIQKYYDPWSQGVINATQAQFENANQQQLNMVRGNAAAQGALGGDREAIAEAATAGQQQLAQAPVIAGLESRGFNTALETALREQQNLGQSAYSLGNLGVAGQNAALTGANAQLGYGTLGQSTQQALDQALYNQFLAQQGYPFQTTQWLAGIDTGVGSQMGGTSSTTGPAPNPWSQILGGGLSAAALLMPKAFGGGVHRDAGGRIRGFQMGGMPYAGGSSYVPTLSLTPGQGAPKPPGLPGQGQQPDPFKLASSTIDLEKKLKGLGNGGLFGGSSDEGLDAATQMGAESGMSPEELGLGEGGQETIGLFDSFRRGGRIAGFAAGGYADGGSPDMPIMLPGDNFEDRFSPSYGLDERLERGLGLGDVTGRYPVPGQDVPLPRSRPDMGGGSDSDYVNPTRVNGQPQNLTGPIIPPGGFGGGPAEPLPPAQDVPDSRVAGVGAAPMSFAPQRDLSGHAPVPGTAGAPAGEEKQGGLFGLHMSDDMRKALLAAGFSMMASRSPFLGNAIGEGGLAGLSAYSGSKKEAFNEEKALQQLEQHRKETEDKLNLETRKLEQSKELAEETKLTPKVLGETSLGQKIYGVMDPRTKQWVDPVSRQPVNLQPSLQAQMPQVPGTASPAAPSGTTAPPSSSSAATAAPAAPANEPIEGAPEGMDARSMPAPPPSYMDEGGNPHGEAFLKTLDPQIAGVVKAIDEGRMQAPTGMMLRTPYGQIIQRALSQYDPNFDWINANARMATRKDFTSGKSAANLTSFNTTVNHLLELDSAINDLNNGRFPVWNRLANTFNYETGNEAVQKAIKRVDTARQAVTAELTRAFRGAAGNVADIVDWNKKFDLNDPANAQHEAVKEAVKLLRGRIEAVGDQYNRGMRTTREPTELLSPKARAGLAKLEGETVSGASGPVRVNSIEEARRLPSGTHFITPDGREKVVP